MAETFFSHGYNQKIFKNLREVVIAEAIDLLHACIRENLVKTGWKSWKQKWREKAFKKRFQKD